MEHTSNSKTRLVKHLMLFKLDLYKGNLDQMSFKKDLINKLNLKLSLPIKKRLNVLQVLDVRCLKNRWIALYSINLAINLLIFETQKEFFNLVND